MVNSVAVLADDRVVSGSGDKTVRLWNPTTGVCDVVLEGHTEVSVLVCVRALVLQSLIRLSLIFFEVAHAILVS